MEQDPGRTGAGPTRNRAIERVRTAWVGFLDDDDRLSEDYRKRFEETLQGHSDADCIVFRAQYPDRNVLPKVPQVTWGNVTVAFAVKTEWARKYPWVKGENAFQRNEDYLFLKTIEDAGAKIVFSPHVCYLVRPSEEAQAKAAINNQ